MNLEIYVTTSGHCSVIGADLQGERFAVFALRPLHNLCVFAVKIELPSP